VSWKIEKETEMKGRLSQRLFWAIALIAIVLPIPEISAATLPSPFNEVSSAATCSAEPQQNRPLSGGALEAACRTSADRALKDSQEWERLGCSAKLHVSPQLFSPQYNVHFDRCKSTTGTVIQSDQESRDKYLSQCRGAGTSTGTATQTTATTTSSTTTAGTSLMKQPSDNTLGGDWVVSLLDLRTLKTYDYIYKLTFSGPSFEGLYSDPKGNPSRFQGSISGDGARIEYTQTDQGYKANFAGRKVGANRFDGAVCDSRGNIFTFTLYKK
jgi:hypothetical protein